MKQLLMGSLVGVLFASQGAYADSLQFSAYLSGAQEVPAVTDTEGRGRVMVRFDKALTRAVVHVKVSNLTGSLAGAHFHCGLPGNNGPVAFGLINPGDLPFDGEEIRGELDNEDFTGDDCTEAVGRPVSNIAALAFAMEEGLIYLNLHTDVVPSGEIRGQMMEDDDEDGDDRDE